jgi:hypothetical protein
MSLKGLLKFGSRLLRGRKESATPTTGQQTKLLSYEGKGSQATGQELARQEIKNPPIVLNKTEALHMGEKTAPAFGSSTYDWVMRKGRGQYTADEWLDHLTSTRKENFEIFGKPATKLVRGEKRFKYDSGPFAGKEVSIGREELFDSNVAIFDSGGNLTGGLLYAAKQTGDKLDANTIGNMIKMNPVNRLKATEFGLPAGALEKVRTRIDDADATLKTLFQQFKNQGNERVALTIDNTRYSLKGLRNSPGDNSALLAVIDDLKFVRNAEALQGDQRKMINKIIGELDEAVRPIKGTKTFYQNERNYTLQGGKDYREVIFNLDESIPTNRDTFKGAGHFVDTGIKNQIYHVRYDTRFTPDGKKGFLIHEIQSDVNQPIAKRFSKSDLLGGEVRTNPFNADIETAALSNQRFNILRQIEDGIAKQDSTRVLALQSSLKNVIKKIEKLQTRRGSAQDYYPFIEADAYNDHALKFLVQKAAREGVDFVAQAPFDKLSFRQGFAAGNERAYGYASGKGIGKRGKAVMPELMKKLAKLYDSKAGPQKFSLSDPKLPYKKVEIDKFEYRSAGSPKQPISENHPLKGKTIQSTYHEDAVKDPKKGYKLILENDPRLYFDAFAIKVTPAMRGTQKTYKKTGGLVVDIFKPMRYNRTWL